MTLQIYNHAIVTAYDLRGSNPIKALREGHVSHMTNNGLIEERYPIIAQGTNGQNIAVETNKIIELREVARFYHSQTEREKGVWLREAATGDIYTRQALIHDITITWLSQRGRSRLLVHGNIFYGELVILRQSQWESIEEQADLRTNVSLIGGHFDVASYYYKGMTGARIDALVIKNPNIGGTSQLIYEAWVGFREKGMGFSSFNPLIECEVGTNQTGDTSNHNQTYFNGGTAKQVTFNLFPMMTPRVRYTLSQFTASNRHHYFGEYLVLLGYQHYGGTFAAKLSGQNVISSQATNLPQVSTQRSRIIELGYIRIPAQPLRDKHTWTNFGDIDFYIEAERTAGINPLFLDFMILMPARHTLKMTPVYNLMVNNGRLYFHQHADRSMTSYQTSSGGAAFQTFIDFEAQNFWLPPDETKMIFAANTYATHTHPGILRADIDLVYRQEFEKYHTG